MPDHPRPTAEICRRKVRRLTLICMLLWLFVTLLPVLLADQGLSIGAWPLDFWMAAQGTVLAYVAIVASYAWLVNRWERQADALSFRLPPRQDN